ASGDMGSLTVSSSVNSLNRLITASPNFFFGLGDFSYDPSVTGDAWCSQFKSSFSGIQILPGDHDTGGHNLANFGETHSYERYVNGCPLTLGVPLVCGPVSYNWSPDGSHLTYIDSDSNQDMRWHLLSSAGDRLLADLGAVPARGANPDSDDLFVGFSADGQYVAVEQTFTPTPIRVHRVSDGSVAYTRTDGTMAAWAGSGARLYFRTSAGVQSWAPGGVVAVSNGTAWIHPHASPDGSRIVFSLLNAQSNHVAEALDLTTASGAIQQLSP